MNKESAEAIIQSHYTGLEAEFNTLLEDAAAQATMDLTDMDWLDHAPGFNHAHAWDKNARSSFLLLATKLREKCEGVITLCESATHPAGKARK